MAALSSKKVYTLEIVGGNSLLHGAVLKVDSDDVLAVAGGTAGKISSPARLRPTESLRVLHVPSEAQHAAGAFYTLQGPSGKGEYQLKISHDTESTGLGFAIKHDEWVIMTADDRLLLRYEDKASCSHWIAVLETNEDGTRMWCPWWVSPNAANMDDFDEYRMIDIELVEDLDDE